MRKINLELQEYLSLSMCLLWCGVRSSSGKQPTENWIEGCNKNYFEFGGVKKLLLLVGIAA